MAESLNTSFGTVTIPEFFSGRHIFITGVTGFMGKVLLEKLLRSCPEIGFCYVLVRPKKGLKPQERVKQLFDSKVGHTILFSNILIMLRIIFILFSNILIMFLTQRESSSFCFLMLILFSKPKVRQIILFYNSSSEVLKLAIVLPIIFIIYVYFSCPFGLF